MAKSKKDFTLLLIALFCSSLAHAQKQVPVEWKDSIDNGSNIILKSATIIQYTIKGRFMSR